MSKPEQKGQQFCGACGAEVRMGNVFCIACGQRLDPEGPDSKAREEHLGGRDYPPTPGTEPPGLVGYFSGDHGAGPTNFTGVLSGVLDRFGFWGFLALILVGLLVSVVLSPLALFAVVLLFGTSLIGVVIRLFQRRSVLRWGGVAVASLFIAFVFNGIANTLYGGVLGGGDADGSVGDGVILRVSGTEGTDYHLSYLIGSDPQEGFVDALGSAPDDYQISIPEGYENETVSALYTDFDYESDEPTDDLMVQLFVDGQECDSTYTESATIQCDLKDFN